MINNLFTYEHFVSGRLVWEGDVRIFYEGGPWGWLVEMFDLNTGDWFKAPRDWHDQIMKWAYANRQEALDEMRHDYEAGLMAAQRLNAAE